MEKVIEKRRRFVLTKDETSIMKPLVYKALVPVGIMIIISSCVLTRGLYFLLKKTSFYNYGISPGISMKNASDFFHTYLYISFINVVLMVLLAVIVCYIALHNIIIPLLRITRELKDIVENSTKRTITVRQTDMVLVPLVALINKLILL
ncbi:MAG: hypothetical protein ABSH12_01195 [Endomicrobiales bacterium]